MELLTIINDLENKGYTQDQIITILTHTQPIKGTSHVINAPNDTEIMLSQHKHLKNDVYRSAYQIATVPTSIYDLQTLIFKDIRQKIKCSSLGSFLVANKFKTSKDQRTDQTLYLRPEKSTLRESVNNKRKNGHTGQPLPTNNEDRRKIACAVRDYIKSNPRCLKEIRSYLRDKKYGDFTGPGLTKALFPANGAKGWIEKYCDTCPKVKVNTSTRRNEYFL